LFHRDGKYPHDELQKHHGGSDGGSDRPFRDGADTMDGGAGHDIMLGDNGTIRPFIADKAPYDATSFLVQPEGRLGHGGDGGSGGGDDVMLGGDGPDLLFGQNGADRLRGQDGDDQLYGGNGDDELDGGTGKNTVKSGDGSVADGDLRIVFENPLLARLERDVTGAARYLDPNGDLWLDYGSDGGSDGCCDSDRDRHYSLLENPSERPDRQRLLDRVFGELLADSDDGVFAKLDPSAREHLRAMQDGAQSDGEENTIALLAILELIEEGTL
jgi:hypothetical protein